MGKREKKVDVEVEVEKLGQEVEVEGDVAEIVGNALDTGSEVDAKGASSRLGGPLAKEFNEKYSRLLAEFDNFRKRAERERQAAYDTGAAGVVLKLLPVADNFERAVKSAADKEDPFFKGVEMIYKQLQAAFEAVGVKEIAALNEPFDPELHNAVMHVEDGALGENVVAEELQKGYVMGDRVLRHSMVKVAN